MNARTLSNKLAALALLLMSNSWTRPAAWAETQTVDTAKIEQLTGLEGKLNDKEGVFKVAVPRSDLKVTVAGMHLTPPMDLRLGPPLRKTVSRRSSWAIWSCSKDRSIP